MNIVHQSILKEAPAYSRFLRVDEIDTLFELITKMPHVHHKIIGKTIQDETLKMLEIGTGDHTALIIGVPHSDEPLGSLVVTYFARWLATHPEVNTLGWRWLFIPILERYGMRLNEGWFNFPESLAAFAKSTFREPTEDQYEWTFPIQYKEYEWTKSRPETLAIKNVLQQEKPNLLCGLHHSGFSNAYYYFSSDFPQAYPILQKFVKQLRIPLSDTAPDVPFGKMLSPGFYQMYGLKDYLDYYQKKDPRVLTSIRRGACSDEWYQNEIGGFSFNCEVPMYLSPMLQDKTPLQKSFKTVLQERNTRKKSRLEYSIKLLNRLKPYAEFADQILYDAAQKHIINAQASLDHEQRIITFTDERVATNAEVFENEVLSDLFDLFFLGQLWRVTDSICIKGVSLKICHLMEAVDIELKGLAKSIQDRGSFYQLPLQTSVKMQLGSILIIADLLKTAE
ncbi:MAG: hypothetical protein KKC68_02765 [Candidatus Thermoplasmatota archaeon]|nr:hypothetical protein [Candidatus Thermoplasmatota archaeon]MBU1940675.1 hypothetical protein [Candidatus Thermoplasmatota archaeon]